MLIKKKGGHATMDLNITCEIKILIKLRLQAHILCFSWCEVCMHACYLSRVHHAQVVHKTGPMLPDLRWGAAEWLHSDFLTAVQFPHCPHHHMHRIKHQRWRKLWEKGKEETQSEETQRAEGKDAMRREVQAQIDWLTGMEEERQNKRRERRDVRYE